jgi:hypothetical protein
LHLFEASLTFIPEQRGILVVEVREDVGSTGTVVKAVEHPRN